MLAKTNKVTLSKRAMSRLGVGVDSRTIFLFELMAIKPTGRKQNS
jgi:hypothetical protein